MSSETKTSSSHQTNSVVAFNLSNSTVTAVNTDNQSNENLTKNNKSNDIVGVFDNTQAMEQFKQLLASIDTNSLSNSIILNQLASSDVSPIGLAPTSSTFATNVVSGASTTSSVNNENSNAKTVNLKINNDASNNPDPMYAALQQQMMESLIQTNNGALNNNLSSALGFGNNLLNAVTASGINSKFLEIANEFGLLNGGNSTNQDVKSLKTKVNDNSTLLTNDNNNTDTSTMLALNSAFSELNSETVSNLMNNLMSNGNFNTLTSQQWKELSPVVNALNFATSNENNEIENQSNNVEKKVKQEKNLPLLIASGEMSNNCQTNSLQNSASSRNSSPAPNVLDQQLMGLLSNASAAELLTALTSGSLSNNANLMAIATAAGIAPNQLTSYVSNIFSAVTGNNDLSLLLANVINNGNLTHTNSNVVGNNTNNVSNTCEGINVASLLAASGATFSFANGSPNKSLDSYCDICDKHLCNRYFLKTHKMKKHGISEDGTTGSPIKSTAPGSFLQNNFDNIDTSNRQFPFKHTEGNEPEGDDGPLAKVPKLNLLPFSSANNGTTVNTLSVSSSAFKTGNTSLVFSTSNETGTTSTTSSAAITSISNSVASVASLFKEKSPLDFFKSSDYLKLNRADETQTNNASTSISGNTNHNNNGSNGDVSPAPQSSSSTASDGGNSTNNNFLNIFQQFPFSADLLNQMLSIGSDIDQQAMLALLKTWTASNVENVFSNDSNQNSNLNSAATTTKAGAPKRQYTSTSKNFCDLCNKEVCNKYFLRTHMLKMHQIVIDENKSIIAKIDTTEQERSGQLSFRCDVCKIEMKTRQDLRQHRIDIHGVLSNQNITPISKISKNNSNVFQTTPIHKASSVSFDSSLVKQQHFNAGAPNSGAASEDGNTEIDEKSVSNFFTAKNESNTEANNNNNNNNNNIKNSTSNFSLINAEIFLKKIVASCGQSIERAENNKCDESDVLKNESLLSSSGTFETNATTSSNILQNIEHVTPIDTQNESGAEECRYCGEYFDSVFKMYQHCISEHSQEFAALENSDQMDIITQVALQMQKANQQQQALATIKSLQNLQKSQHQLDLKREQNDFNKKLQEKQNFLSHYCGKCYKEFPNKEICSAHVIQHFLSKKFCFNVEKKFNNNEKEINLQNNEKLFEITDDEQKLYLKLFVCERETPVEDFTAEIVDNSTTNDNNSEFDDKIHGLSVEIGSDEQDLNFLNLLSADTLSSENSLSLETNVTNITNIKNLVQGFAEQHSSNLESHLDKPYTIQALKMNLVSEKTNEHFFNKLMAYLPVRKTLNTPVKATFELEPQPEVNEKIYNI